MAKCLITKAMGAMESEITSIIYVKGHEKREWLQNLLLDEAREEVYIKNINAYYKDKSLNKLNVTQTLRCQKHVSNCALQNVFKVFNWWADHNK